MLQILTSKVHLFHLLHLIQLKINLLNPNNKIKKKKLIMNLRTKKLSREVEAQIGCFLHLYRPK